MSSPKSQGSSPRGEDPPPAQQGINPETGHIEVDNSDADSSYAESTAVTDTTSLRSSILAYKWEHGRRYHAYQDGAYWGPNDETQQDAEDLVHEMFRIILGGKLFEAPIREDPHKVLDVGCGTGIWAIEFADQFPSAEVIGVDLSPIQPPYVPPNCKFEVDDVNKAWTYKPDAFDFIHVRAMTGCVPDWVDFYKKALTHLKPGGWVEQIELSSIARADDGTIAPDSPLVRWITVFEQMGEKLGKTFSACELARDAIERAGFVNVRERRIKVPIGTWPKDRDLKQWGAWNRMFLIQGLEGFAIRGLTALLGWSYEEAQVYLASMRKELTDPKVHSYIEMCVVAGQKPESSEET
ncbi:Sam dependent methyltransferase [Pleurostoma richardsiae]|uniref:Sam dependent methyltransferase n=1 Tax=Pleurostoma richardsiae TaxID=41990 RepID=A0AA38RP92_9PEZI|nr:Sam dependent methyltransferase [Pleurostoma richardsiae]